MSALFRVHWFCKNKRVYPGPFAGGVNAIPLPGDEVRQSDLEFYRVVRRVWCYDEDADAQRVNIELKKIK